MSRSTVLIRRLSLLVALMLVVAACSGAPSEEVADGVEAGAATPSTLADGSPAPFAPGATPPVTDASGAVVPGTEATDPLAPGTPGAAAGTPGGASTAPGAPGASAVPGGQADAGTGAAPAPASSSRGAGLYSGDAAVRGITDDTITLCGHAALTFGPAFNATSDDFNVYYDAINDAGGVNGRKIVATYENDNYDPKTAVEAAEACRAKNPFMILGGIGFDQIPAVRNWAEANKELYFHHIATVQGADGKRFSYTTQPSVERVGRAFAELTASRFAGKKVGILYRNSEFWAPGYEAFKAVAEERGINVVLAVPVEKNQGNYTQQLVALKNAGAEVVWGWENTLALTQMVKQAKAQLYSPSWVAFPFNLTSQTLGDQALTPPMVGLASWPGYSKGDYGGSFAPYAADMKLFEAQYAKYRPGTDIGGAAGDLLWINWVEQKRLVEMFRACGRDCTRDTFVGMLAAGYRATSSPTCALDFSGGRHDGSGGLINVMETYRSPSGAVNWRSTALCQGS